MKLQLKFHVEICVVQKLRQIFGSKRDENGEWRGLHNEELHCLYHSFNILRVKIKMGRASKLRSQVMLSKKKKNLKTCFTDQKSHSIFIKWQELVKMGQMAIG